MMLFSLTLTAFSMIPLVSGKLSGSFEQAVVQGSTKRARSSNNARGNLYRGLLQYARPYKAVERKAYNSTNTTSYDYDNFDFDVNDYSFKFVKCQTIRSFSDNLAKYRGDGYVADTVLAPEQFVVFRYCASASCSNSSALGCTEDYGEYILKLSDYLSVMYKYNLQRKENFCNYCANTCGYRRRLEDVDGDGNGDDGAAGEEQDNMEAYYEAEVEEDNAQEEEDNENAVEEDNAENNVNEDDQSSASSSYSCDACANATNVCNGDANDYSGYFQCSAVQDSYGNNYYVGPQCSSDGRSINITVFSDQYCYSPNTGVNAAYVTGVTFEDDAFAEYFPSDCTSCGESNDPWEQANDDADQDQVNAMCENLYYYSGKCNKNYRYKNKGVYGGYRRGNKGLEQVMTDSLVCSFIENVLSGYTESGEIDTRKGWFTKKSSLMYSEVKVTSGQVFGLCFAMVACIGLAGYSCFLHRAIMKKAPWRPNRSGVAALAGQISRVNSGIILGRSRSSGSAISPGGSLA